MHGLNLTYNDVLDIVRKMVQADNDVFAGKSAGGSYYSGKSDALRGLLLRWYTVEEITAMKNDVIQSEKGGVTNDED